MQKLYFVVKRFWPVMVFVTIIPLLSIAIYRTKDYKPTKEDIESRAKIDEVFQCERVCAEKKSNLSLKELLIYYAP